MTHSRARQYRLRTRLVASLALLVALVGITGGAAMVSAAACRGAMAEAHRFEVAARTASSLGRLAREQYIHEAHTIILGDRSHLAHHDAWVKRFQADASAFRPDLPPDAVLRLDAILADSQTLATVFATQIVPAIASGDREGVRTAHERATQLVDRMTAHADALGNALDARALAAEQRAERASSWMLALAGLTTLLATLFAVQVARRLWAAFEAPLARLREVSERVTADVRSARVGPLAAEELSIVGAAFDAMLDTLAQKERALVQAERLALIGRMAAGVAHEVNNPITVIRGFAAQLLRDERALAVREEVEIIDEEAAACQRITEELLTSSRSPPLQLEEVNARALAEDVVTRTLAALEPGVHAGEVALDVRPALLRVDRLRMRQVLVNLLRNALQSGGAPVELSGQIGPDDSYVFRVRDRGPGLSAESRERLFEPFFTTRPGGAGLGLSVSRGLVVAHGGRLHLADRPSGGLEAVVALPCCLTGAVAS